MIGLFIDTSHLLTIGIFDEKFNWLCYVQEDEMKSSGIIHYKINSLLDKNKKSTKDISRIIIANGPGSYTGVRVGEGIGQVFDWQGVETLSFHHYQIPSLIGIESGNFICPAFKGEYFHYKWNSTNSESILISYEDVIEICEVENEIYSNQIFLEDQFNSSIKNTMLLIKNNISELFPKIISLKLRDEPFYFRKLNEEFSKAKK